VSCQCFSQLPAIGRLTTTARQYDHIETTKFALMMTKAFPNQALEAISVDGSAQDLL